MFLLGFILDFIEITFIVIPLIGPALFTLGFDPLWLGILIALVLQTSFITPPFGFSLFYLGGVLPRDVKTIEIYKGIVPFLIIQVILMICVFTFPSLATFLPELLLKWAQVGILRYQSPRSYPTQKIDIRIINFLR